MLRLCYEVAALAGVDDPGPYTLRELAWRSGAKSRERWCHTTSLVVAIYNHTKSKGDRLIEFDELYPFADARDAAAAGGATPVHDMGLLKADWLSATAGRGAAGAAAGGPADG